MLVAGLGLHQSMASDILAVTSFQINNVHTHQNFCLGAREALNQQL